MDENERVAMVSDHWASVRRNVTTPEEFLRYVSEAAPDDLDPERCYRELIALAGSIRNTYLEAYPA